MKIEAFAICYNEEALLPYYLRHYSEFCDRITIYDNQSTDRSREICLANPKVKVIPYNTGDEIRDDVYLQIKNNCWKGSEAHWVIIGDIDELVYCPDIKARLYGLDYTVIAPELFNMYAKHFPRTKVQIWQEVLLGVPGGAKMNLFRPDKITNINYDPGCHVAHPEGIVIPGVNTGIKTLHMKYMGLDYYLARTALSNSRLSALNKKLGWGIHYQRTPEELTREFNEGLSNAVNVI